MYKYRTSTLPPLEYNLGSYKIIHSKPDIGLIDYVYKIYAVNLAFGKRCNKIQSMNLSSYFYHITK